MWALGLLRILGHVGALSSQQRNDDKREKGQWDGYNTWLAKGDDLSEPIGTRCSVDFAVCVGAEEYPC